MGRPSLSVKLPTTIMIKSIRAQISQTPEGQQLGDSGSDFPDVEPVDSEYPKEEAEQNGRHEALGAYRGTAHRRAGCFTQFHSLHLHGLSESCSTVDPDNRRGALRHR